MKHIWKKVLFLVCFLFLAGAAPKSAYADDFSMQVTAFAVSGSKIELQWSAMEQASSYAIYRRSSTEGNFQKIIETPDTVYRDTGIRAAVAYYYKIVPIAWDTGKEIKVAQVTVKVKAPAETSIEKITVKSPTELKLVWKAAAGSSGYQILRSDRERGGYTEIARVNGQSARTYTDEEVIPGKIYYYKVRPISQGGQGFGNYSAVKKARTIAKTAITSISSLASDRMQITWKKVSGAKAYEVYRGTRENGAYKKVATLNAAARRYVDKAVKSGKRYHYRIVSVGSFNGEKITSGYSEPVAFRALQQVKILSVRATDDDGLKIKWGKVAGATKYKIYRSASKTGSFQKIATVDAAPLPDYTDNQVISGKMYYYKVQAYSDGQGVISAGSGTKSSTRGASTAYAIMGKTDVTVDQMVALYQASGKRFPSSVYRNKGAKNIEEFCKIVILESEVEGVRAEVIFAQICLETGYLQFGGQVSAEQCNFSGLGATDDGAAGATFPDVATGIRAQVQHLKGYASKESLNQKCVDPRFMYLASKRGTAKHVQNLGNGNWATDPDYAYKLMGLIKAMKSY